MYDENISQENRVSYKTESPLVALLLKSVFFSFPTKLSMNLSHSRKWLFLFAIILLVLSFTSGALYLRVSSSIKTMELEERGLALLSPVFKTVQYIQQHRGYSAGVLGGATVFTKKRSLKQAETIEAFNQMTVILPKEITNGREWEIISNDWNTLIRNGMNWSIEENHKAHTLLIDRINNLTQTIADKYALTNQADIDTHYLLNTIFLQLAPAQEYLGQLRSAATALLSKASSTEQERSNIATLISKSETAVALLQRNLLKTGNFNPTIQEELKTTSTMIIANSQHIYELVREGVFQSKHSVRPEFFFEIITQAIDSTYLTLNNVFIPTIAKLIKERLDGEKQVLIFGSSTVLLIILLLLYFSIGIYLAMMHNIRSLSEMTIAFAKGDFSSRIRINPKSELKVVGDGFNHMADQVSLLMDTQKENGDRVQAIMNAAIDAMVQMNEKGELIGWSHQAESIFGWKENEVIGRPLHEIIIPERYQDAHCTGLKRFVETGQGPIMNKVVEIEARKKNGEEFPIELVVTQAHIKSGYEFSAFIRDVTERKKSEESLRLSAEIFQHSLDGIVITDIDANIVNINPAFTEITGYSREEVLGKNPKILGSGKHPQSFYKDMWRTLIDNGEWKGEMWNRKKSGELYAERLNISVVKDQEGNSLHYIGFFSDVTSAKIQQDKLEMMAHYDLLTQLPNRVLLADRFLQSVALAKRNKKGLAVCFLDLDKFKPVNDSYGHTIGDLLLIEVAARIKNTVRAEDTVSRLGGDEFAMILVGAKNENEFVQLLDRVIKSCAKPYKIEGYQIEISLSIGVAVAQSDDDDLSTLLHQADIAMYKVKQSGRNGYHFFDSDVDYKT